MITRIIYHMRKEMIVEIRLNYIVLRRIASKRPLLFDPKITFFKTFSRNPWQFQKEIVTLWYIATSIIVSSTLIGMYVFALCGLFCDCSLMSFTKE